MMRPVFRAVLLLFPTAFRHRYAADMLQALLDRRDQVRRRGLLSLIAFDLAALLDLIVNAFAEHTGQPGRGLDGPSVDTGSVLWRPLGHDVRDAVRVVCRRPSLSLLSVLTLALGLGGVTAVVSIVNAVFVQPLPFPMPEQVVAIRGVTDGRAAGISLENLQDVAAQTRAMSAVSPFFAQSVNLTGVPEPDRLRGAFVSSAFFDVIGVRPALGAAFSKSADTPNGTRAAVLTHDAWQNRFGARPDIVGHSAVLNNVVFTVVGVMPRHPTFPIDEAEVFLPVWAATIGAARGNHSYLAVGRLRPGVSAKQASEEVDAITARLERQFPSTNRGRRARVEPLRDSLVEAASGVAPLLFVMVAIMLAAACANVAGLQLGDTASRRQEMGIRSALGAGRGRIARQLLIESTVRAIAAAPLGLLAAHGTVQYLVAYAPTGVYGLENTSVSPSVMLATLPIAVLTGIAAGLPGAMQWGRGAPWMSTASRVRATGDLQSARFRRGLVVCQIALAAVLLVATGLTMRSFDRLTSVDVGFDPANLLTMEYRLPRNKYSSPAAQAQFHRQVLERVREVRGIVAAAGVRALPFSGNGSTTTFRADSSAGGRTADINTVSANYFETLRIPLVEGRLFTPSDQTVPVVLVSRAFARATWPGVSPVGRSISFDDVRITATVVGVVGDVRHRDLATGDAGTIYVLQDQNPGVFNTLAVRTERAPLAAADAVRRALWTLDPDQPVWKVRSLDSLIDESVASRSFLLQVVSFFGFSVACLAVLGLYSVVATAVVQRTREIGVRRALGATTGGVLGLVLLEGVRLSALGVAIGLASGLIAGNMLRSYLFGISTGDPATFAAAGLTLLLCSAAACWFPARRALRLNPIIALRGD